MSTTAPSPPAAAQPKARSPQDGRLRMTPLRRRSLPWLLAGVLLVVGCALAFAVTTLRVGGRDPVLALSHPVPAGHVLTRGDLRVVQVAASPQLGLVSASERARVLGSVTAVPLSSGALVTQNTLGPASYPRAGQAIAAVSLEAGRFPPSLTPGAQVAVTISRDPSAPPSDRTTTGASHAGGTPAVEATVTAVQRPRQSSRGTVVSLRMPEPDATTVASAAAAGNVSLVLLSPEGGGTR